MRRFNSYVSWCMKYVGEVEAVSFLWCQMVCRSPGWAERWCAELPVDYHSAVELATKYLVKCWDVARGTYAAYSDASAPEGTPSVGSSVDKKGGIGQAGEQSMTVHGLFLRSGSLRLPAASPHLVGRDATSPHASLGGFRYDGYARDVGVHGVSGDGEGSPPRQGHHAMGDELWYSPEHVDDDDGFNAWPRRVEVKNYRLSKGSSGYEYDVLLDSLELKASARELYSKRPPSQNYDDVHLKAMAGAAQSALALFRNLVVFMCRAQAVLRDRSRAYRRAGAPAAAAPEDASGLTKDASGLVSAKDLLSDQRDNEGAVLTQIQFILERADAMDAGALLASQGPDDHEWAMRTMALLHQVVEIIGVEGAGVHAAGTGGRSAQVPHLRVVPAA